MAFRGSVGGPSTSIASTLGGGVSSQQAMDFVLNVVGKEGVVENMRNFAAMAVYTSVMTTKRMATAIYTQSQKNVPYDRGDLFRSAGDGPFKLEGPDGDVVNPNNLFGKFTAVDANIEGTYAYAMATPAGAGMVAPNWAVKSQYGTKMVSKWAVAYNRDGMADHAIYVHENPKNIDYKQGKGPYPTEPKIERFLAVAFDMYSSMFEPSMRNALQQAMTVTDRRAAQQAQQAASEARAVSASPRPLGAPRLVRRGG